MNFSIRTTGRGVLPRFFPERDSLTFVSNTARRFIVRSSSSTVDVEFSRPANFHEGQRELREALMDRNLMGTGSVDLDVNESARVAVVTLNHPEKRNALSGAMMMDLGRVTSELASWKTGVGVVMKGVGNNFCSGGDLNLVKEIANPSDGLLMAKYMHAVLTQFYRLPTITVALIRGNAVGGGAELATACDFRLMHPDARIGFVQSKMGVATGWGGGTRLVHLLGRHRALKLLVSGALLRANEAMDMDLADDVLEDSEEDGNDADAAIEFINKFVSRKDANVVRTAKMIATVAAEQDLEQALEIERILFSGIWGGEPHLNAMAGNIKHKD